MQENSSNSRFNQDALNDKRDSFRVKIRKEKHKEFLKNKRNRLDRSSEQTALLNIDCTQTIHYILSNKLNIPEELDAYANSKDFHSFLEDLKAMQKQIYNLTLYATSSHYQHILSFFDETVVEVLLQLVSQTYRAKTTDKELALILNSIFGGLVWTLSNYIGLGGGELISFGYIEIMLAALKKSQVSIKDNVLTSLGLLSEFSHYRQLILVADIFDVILESQLPHDGVIYFLMYFVPCSTFGEYERYIDRILKLLLINLYEQTDWKMTKNILQTLRDIFCSQNISQHTNFIVENQREVKGIQEWFLGFRCFTEPNKQKFFEDYLPRSLDTIAQLYSNQPRSDFEEEYNQFIQKQIFPGTVELITRHLASSNARIRDCVNKILENICCNEDLAEQLMYRYTHLVDHMIASLTSNSHEETYYARRSCMFGLCNLCLVLSENDVIQLVNAKGLVKLLAEKLNEYEDAKVNMKMVRALQSIFDIGRMEKEQLELYGNRMVREFDAADGTTNFMKLFNHNNEELKDFAMQIYDKYYEIQEQDKLEESL